MPLPHRNAIVVLVLLLLSAIIASQPSDFLRCLMQTPPGELSRDLMRLFCAPQDAINKHLGSHAGSGVTVISATCPLLITDPSMPGTGREIRMRRPDGLRPLHCRRPAHNSRLSFNVRTMPDFSGRSAAEGTLTRCGARVKKGPASRSAGTECQLL